MQDWIGIAPKMLQAELFTDGKRIQVQRAYLLLPVILLPLLIIGQQLICHLDLHEPI